MTNSMNIFLLIFLIFTLGACVPQGNQVEQSSAVSRRNLTIDPILAQRKTINPFLAWNAGQGRSGNYYGLTWTKEPRRGNYRQSKSLIRLSEIYWNYYYPNKGWLNYPGVSKYLTSRNWAHAAEYGKTLATDITSEEFLEYISEIGSREISKSNAHGVMLDWWHDYHQGGFSTGQVRKARIKLISELRKSIGHDSIIIGNVNWERDSATVSKINGVFLELYKKSPSEGVGRLYSQSELFEIESLLQYYEKRLAYPKLIALEGWRQTKSISDADRNNLANRRMAKIMTAMSVVIPTHGYILYGDNNFDTAAGDHDHLYYDFYRFDIGQPTSGYQNVSRGVGFKEHSRGIVAYNITSSDKLLTTADGRKINVPANSGLFCKYLATSESCLSEN